MRIVDRTAYSRADGGLDEPLARAHGWRRTSYPIRPATSTVLQGAADDVHVFGPETVRGDATTHYTATLDLARPPGPHRARRRNRGP